MHQFQVLRAKLLCIFAQRLEYLAVFFHHHHFVRTTG